MNHRQKIEFQTQAERYLEKNGVSELFDKLLKGLLIDKPEAPIDYLIKKLKGKEIRKLFVIGPAGVLKLDIAKVIAQRFGFKILSSKDIIREEWNAKNPDFIAPLKAGEYVPDRVMIDAVMKRIRAMEENQKSYILTGFPRTRVQAIALQRAGCIPERVLFVEGTQVRFISSYSERYSLIVGEEMDPQDRLNLVDSQEMHDNAQKAWKEYEYHADSVKEQFPFLKLPVDGNTDLPAIIERVSRVLAVRGRTKRPQPAPKVLIFGAPGSGRTTQANLIADRYGLVKISCSDVIRREIERHTEVGEALARVPLGRLAPDDLVIGLMRNRLLETDCRMNGWIMEGFPRNAAQATAMVSLGFEPSHVFFLNASDALVYSRLEERRMDPFTGKFYSSFIPPPSDEIRLRLIKDPADEPDVIKIRLRQYKENSTALMAEFQKLSVMVKAELEIEMITERIGEPLEQAF